MKVSIIIPTFNFKRYVFQAIESALSQAYRDFEVLVIDDGSTDGTFEAVNKYIEDNHISPEKLRVFQKPNGGTASALNMGIKIARGEWIKWLSADDVMYPHYLLAVFREIEKLTFPEGNIFYTSYNYINEKGKLTGAFVEVNHNTETQEQRNHLLLENFYGNGSSSLIHKYVFWKAGLFDEMLPYSEDYEFWLRATILHDFKLYLVPQMLIAYRRHNEQISRKVNASIDWYIKDKIKKAIELKPKRRVNILLARGSPRDLPDVQKEMPLIPADKIIARWVREWDAYWNMLKFFEERPEYTHIAVAADDIVVKKENMERLQELIQEYDFPVISGVMNVEENDLDVLAITPPDNVPHMIWSKRQFDFIKKSNTKGNIVRVGFDGFCLTVFRRDVIEKIRFDSDGPDNGWPMEKTGSLDVVTCWKCWQLGIPVYADTSNFMMHQRRRQEPIKDKSIEKLIFWPYLDKPVNLRVEEIKDG